MGASVGASEGAFVGPLLGIFEGAYVEYWGVGLTVG